jgi:hypothetical protein
MRSTVDPGAYLSDGPVSRPIGSWFGSVAATAVDGSPPLTRGDPMWDGRIAVASATSFEVLTDMGRARLMDAGLGGNRRAAPDLTHLGSGAATRLRCGLRALGGSTPRPKNRTRESAGQLMGLSSSQQMED